MTAFALPVALAALIALSGCAGRVRYPSYYAISLPPPPLVDPQEKAKLGPVAVRELAAPDYLREGAIVYRSSPQQLGFYDYHRWAADPRTSVTRVLIRKLQARGLFQSVALFDGSGKSGYILSGTLDRLEEVDQARDVTVVVSLSVQLTDLESGSVVWRDTSLQSAKVEDRSIGGVVAEMSHSIDVATECVASSLERHFTLTSLAGIPR